MIVVLQSPIVSGHMEAVLGAIEAYGLTPHLLEHPDRTVIGAVGGPARPSASKDERAEALRNLPGVREVIEVSEPYQLASRSSNPEGSKVQVAPGVVVGGERVVTFAGPCSVESEDQLFETAVAVQELGAQLLRAGAYKPRSSPYAFQGLEERGLELLARVGQRLGMPVVTEVVNPQDIPLVAAYADVLQVGARNAQNFALLKCLGRAGKPVLLKRGMMTTVEEILMSAEYVLAHGNPRVILCERGIRTFETATRNTLDLSAVPVLQQKSHLPVIVDPSHATGLARYVPRMAFAAVAAGADGLLVEVHRNPGEAACDGPQSLSPGEFADMMAKVRRFAEAAGRRS
ncbi:MAG: 3-deoxy-7-phosphoheptulonate synthase [Deltaproteobacteria bacterium]|nr:3-deoxy-7-phosphoheptulonate synthase [Deltaproteobacteria bacterium]